MLRQRLAATALVALCLLPGCKCFGDRSNLLSRSNDVTPSYPYGSPSYPITSGGPAVGDPNCQCQQGGPIYGGPPQPGVGGAVIMPPGSTLPPPGELPKIPPPKIGIQESPGTGKQFETDGKEMGKKANPIPTVPVVGPALPVPVLPHLK